MPTPMTSNSPALVAMVEQHGADGGGSGGAGAVMAMVFIANNDLLTMGMWQKDREEHCERRLGVVRAARRCRTLHLFQPYQPKGLKLI